MQAGGFDEYGVSLQRATARSGLSICRTRVGFLGRRDCIGRGDLGSDTCETPGVVLIQRGLLEALFGLVMSSQRALKGL